MPSKSKHANQKEAKLYNIADSTVCAEPWWSNTTEYSSFAPTAMRGNASDSSSLEQSVDAQSLSEGGMNEEDDNPGNQSASTKPLQPDRSYRKEDTNLQQVEPTLHPRPDGSLTHPAQLELVGHSIACASNPYDPYYGGMVAAYGQPMVPHLYDMHHMRMPLPLEMAQEPVYVNAKQYHGILRRRQSRAKAELERKLIKSRKPYLHESRHQHAMRRARGTGGRFAKKTNGNASKGAGSGSDSGGSKMAEAHNSDDADSFRKQTNLQEPVNQARPVETGKGPASGRQWGNIQSNHVLAMQ